MLLLVKAILFVFYAVRVLLFEEHVSHFGPVPAGK